MNKRLISVVGFAAMVHAESALAVDQSSDAYQAGNLVGKIFLAVLVFLIVKKVFFNKR